MDHSPAEQLMGNNDWHTTTLILSESAAQWSVAGEIATAAGRQTGRLTKWSRCSPNQKTRFVSALSEALPTASMFVTSISAREQEIEFSFPQILAQLGLSNFVRSEERNGKPYLVFGPFTRVAAQATEDPTVWFPIIRARAIRLLLIVHFIARTHQKLYASLSAGSSEFGWLNWQVSAHRLVGDIDGQMSKLFFALLSLLQTGRIVLGRLLPSTFLESDPGNELADNIAGMLQDELAIGGDRGLAKLRSMPDKFYWEVWQRDDSTT